MLRSIRSNAIALLALCIAVGGSSAWAATQIGSNQIKANAIQTKHIAKNAVVAKHIKAGQVTSSTLDVVASTRTAAIVNLDTTTAPISEDVKVKAERGDLLAIHGRVDIKRLHPVLSVCWVRLRMEGPVDDNRVVLQAMDNVSTQRRYIAGGSNAEPGIGVEAPLGAEPITFAVVEPGTYTFQLRGQATNQCEYSERNLAVSVIR